MNMTNVLMEGYRNIYLQEVMMASLPHLGKDIAIEGLEIPEHMDIFLKQERYPLGGVNALAGYIMDKVSGIFIPL